MGVKLTSMTNREIHQGFLWMASAGEVRAAYNKFTAEGFLHHNQYFKGDRDSLMLAMEEAHKTSPNKKITFKQTFEDRNFVITHSEVAKDDGTRIAVVHISKIENGKIVELWDLGQVVDPKSPNEKGPF